MKAEIVQDYGHEIQVALCLGDGPTVRTLWFDADEALAIHAALTEWKAKREKPVEPKWRAWKSADEVPVGKFIRPKSEAEKLYLIVGTNGAAIMYGINMGMVFHLALERCEWSPDGVTWNRCGVLAE